MVRPALAASPGPLIDDDLALVTPWGFDPADLAVPTLFLHGADDRMIPSAHSAWLAARVPVPSCASSLATATSRSSSTPPPRWTGCGVCSAG